MAINNISPYSTKFRIGGLATGMDTDQMVKDMMRVERLPLDRLYQRKQLAEWRRDSYRDITSILRGFKDDYMNYLKPSTNMLSTSIYKKYSASAVDTGTGLASTVVSATGGIDASAGTHTIAVTKMAAADKAVSSSGVTKALQSSAEITAANITSINTGNAKSIKVTLDGVTKEITLGTTYTNVQSIVDDLQVKINIAFGDNKITLQNVAAGTGEGIRFTTANEQVSRISVYKGTADDGLQFLRFSSGESNRLNTGLTLGQLAASFANPLTFGGGTTEAVSSADITASNLSSLYDEGNSKGKSFSITIDGVTKTYTFTSDPSDVGSLASSLNSWIETEFGAGKVSVTEAPAGRLAFTRTGAGYFTMNSGPGSEDALALMHVASGSTASGQIKFTINSKEFTFNASQSLSTVMNAINSDTTAKVNMKYDETTDKFSMTATQLGAGENIVISSQTLGNFFSVTSTGVNGAIGIDMENPIVEANGGEQGIDADVTIDGQRLIRSDNTFTVNGVTYTLLRESGVEQKVTLNIDSDNIFNNILNFVNKYNEVLDKINTKLSEEYDRDFQPLTDEQREGLSEDEIKKWEEKAKSGLLRNDPALDKIVRDMRRALYDAVEGLRLPDIGIKTDVYSAKGKLVIDETKLKDAIRNDPDSVMTLFSRQSPSQPMYKRTLSASEMSVRYAEEGLVHRLNDIIEENTSALRNTAGYKGTLLEKAGMIGDSSEFTSSLFKEIDGYDDRIKELAGKLIAKEDKYYARFAAMEKMISQMNNQSNWLASQLSKGG